MIVVAAHLAATVVEETGGFAVAARCFPWCWCCRLPGAEEGDYSTAAGATARRRQELPTVLCGRSDGYAAVSAWLLYRRLPYRTVSRW